MSNNKKIYLALDETRSVHNVGSIFRTADGFGVDKILLSANCPAPIDRFGRIRNDFAKVALGAENFNTYEICQNLKEELQKLQQDGFKIISIEQNENSKKLQDLKNFNEKIVLVLGNEVQGVSKEIIDISDEIYEIEMKGDKESFNVSVTAGIVLYQVNSCC